MKNKIYSIPSSLNTLTNEISRRISDKYRLEHTLSVAKECLVLADIFAFSDKDTERICTAALLHDVVKGLAVDEYIALDKKYYVGFTSDDLECPAVLHAKAGARVAEREFSHCTDDGICKAIAEHTTGAENMSIMSKLLFVADYIEPMRKWETCQRTREHFYSEIASKKDPLAILDKVMIKILSQTESHLLENGKKVHPDAIKCKEFILKSIE